MPKTVELFQCMIYFVLVNKLDIVTSVLRLNLEENPFTCYQFLI